MVIHDWNLVFLHTPMVLYLYSLMEFVTIAVQLAAHLRSAGNAHETVLYWLTTHATLYCATPRFEL